MCDVEGHMLHEISAQTQFTMGLMGEMRKQTQMFSIRRFLVACSPALLFLHPVDKIFRIFDGKWRSALLPNRDKAHHELLCLALLCHPTYPNMWVTRNIIRELFFQAPGFPVDPTNYSRILPSPVRRRRWRLALQKTGVEVHVEDTYRSGGSVPFLDLSFYDPPCEADKGKVFLDEAERWNLRR